MATLKTVAQKLIKNEDGAALVEYGMLVALIAANRASHACRQLMSSGETRSVSEGANLFSVNQLSTSSVSTSCRRGASRCAPAAVS